MPSGSAWRRLQALTAQVSGGEQVEKNIPRTLAIRSCASRTGTEKPIRAHLVCGGYMVVTKKLQGDHDISYCRRRLLDMFEENEQGPIWATTSNDYSELERWLEPAKLMVSYCSGPFATAEQTEQIQKWLEKGGKWVALHGSSGGVAKRIEGGKEDAHPFGGQRKFVKQRFHETLGAFFVNHPPIHEFKVKVTDTSHPVTQGVPAEFLAEDELYMCELQGVMSDYKILLTTEYVQGPEMDPKIHEFVHDGDGGALADGKTRVLGYERKVGKGAIFYMGLGHTNTANKRQPKGGHYVWENPAFEKLVKNAIKWASAD